jgi:hypothetical protein
MIIIGCCECDYYPFLALLKLSEPEVYRSPLYWQQKSIGKLSLEDNMYAQ